MALVGSSTSTFLQLKNIELLFESHVLLGQKQCDQIGQFLHLGNHSNHSKPVGTIILLKLPTLFGNYCKDVKIINFSSEIIFGQLLWWFLSGNATGQKRQTNTLNDQSRFVIPGWVNILQSYTILICSIDPLRFGLNDFYCLFNVKRNWERNRERERNLSVRFVNPKEQRIDQYFKLWIG